MEALKHQIDKDVVSARRYLKSVDDDSRSVSQF